MNALTLTIQSLKLASENLVNQMTSNSMVLRLLQKFSSKMTTEIQAKYGLEKDRIRNEIADLDKAENRLEYEDLMTELKDIQDQQDAEIEQIENEVHDKEEAITVENDRLETENEDAQAQIESFEQARTENIEDSFGYFQ